MNRGRVRRAATGLLGATLLTSLAACVAGGYYGEDGYGYAGGVYEPYGYYDGGWGPGYRVGPPGWGPRGGPERGPGRGPDRGHGEGPGGHGAPSLPHGGGVGGRGGGGGHGAGGGGHGRGG
jgi:hypothetical protein